MIQLRQSAVAFNEECHSYYLGDKRLVGITGLIHQVLKLGEYGDASDFVKQVAIPRAAQYGSAVHKAIETYDELGVKQTTFPNTFGDEPWDVSQELECYIKHLNGFIPLANEYTVTDGEKWASNIDNVWLRESTNGVWLVDTKTNNLNYYPLDGYGQSSFFADHADALKEYLSWQLSVYAELFEAQNPGIKVEGLASNWLRRGDAAFWVIERKPSEKVKELLNTVWSLDDEGVIHYNHPNPSLIVPTLSTPAVPIAQATSLQVVSDMVIELITENLRRAAEAEANLKKLKEELRTAMEKHGVKSWKTQTFSSVIAVDSERETFDTKRFKAEHPDLYEQYVVKKVTKGSFTLKLI